MNPKTSEPTEYDDTWGEDAFVLDEYGDLIPYPDDRDYWLEQHERKEQLDWRDL